MRDKILIVVICLLGINALWGIFKPSEQPNYGYEREMYHELQKDIKTVYTEVQGNKAEIINFKHKIDEVDTIYNDIDKPGLRYRSRDIFRRYNMLHNK